MLLRLLVWLHTLRAKEEGQTTSEYALVILAAAAVAVVLITWARSTGKLPQFVDSPQSFENFGKTLVPILDELGIKAQPEVHEVYKIQSAADPRPRAP